MSPYNIEGVSEIKIKSSSTLYLIVSLENFSVMGLSGTSTAVIQLFMISKVRRRKPPYLVELLASVHCGTSAVRIECCWQLPEASAVVGRLGSTALMRVCKRLAGVGIFHPWPHRKTGSRTFDLHLHDRQ